MKIFLAFFLAGTLLFGYFWLTDGPGSGMAWPTGIFAVLLLGTLAYNWKRTGNPLSDRASLNDKAK